MARNRIKGGVIKLCERGSAWNRWDFQIHTPYSILNNQYGFTPNANYGEHVEQFDEYVRQLFTKAVENGVVAIGITDYFSIEGYKRIRTEYLSKDVKMERLFPDKTLREQISRIFVFPNIELRLDTFVGESARSVNYHVLFSDQVKPDDIVLNFIQQLKIVFGDGTEAPVNEENIKRIGHEFKQYNSVSGSDYHVGLEHLAFSYQQIKRVLDQSAVLNDKFLIAIPVDEDLSQVSWNGRDSLTRKNLYVQSHLLLTSNENTRNWALARGHEEEQKKEFGSIKPCIWGSDAHEYNKLFIPNENRFCWIKAKPSFEGLKQLLYEPAERVRIQKECPEEKDPHQIIDHIVFNHADFPSAPIYFNEDLNCIIGGKSTGKSILLRHIAKVVDAKTVAIREAGDGKEKKLDVEAVVKWKDGEAGERKIIYIPQSWLNRVVDSHSGVTEINNLIENVLLQNKDIEAANKIRTDNVANILKQLKHNIFNFINESEEANKLEEELKTKGRSVFFESTIKQLVKERDEISKTAGVTPEDVSKYSDLQKKIFALVSSKMELEKQAQMLVDIPMPYAYIHNYTFTDSITNKPNYNFESLPTLKQELENVQESMNHEIKEIWERFVAEGKISLQTKIDSVEQTINQAVAVFEPLKKAVAENDKLKDIEKKLVGEQDNLQKAQNLEKEKIKHSDKAMGLKTQIIQSIQDLTKEYEKYSDTVIQNNQERTDLLFNAEVHYRKRDLFEKINSIFNVRHFRTFKEKYHYNLMDEDELKIDVKLFESLFDALIADELVCKSGFTKQEALEEIFKDWNFTHYVIKSDNDTIETMSPGKKALVLLELQINLENSHCPLLIDQPEDDLDNRSIYTELVKYLKLKKHERQIIVVTHNANVVLGADAEEVIIANQAGREAKNYKNRFEYRCGAIEDNLPVYGEDNEVLPGILNQKGIQEQICDILEGGKTAFELRRDKYFSTKKM